jgi:hypothetical protein
LPGNLCIDSVSEIGIEGGLIETWEFLVQLDAEDLVFRHDFPLDREKKNYLIEPRFIADTQSVKGTPLFQWFRGKT